MVSDPRRWWSRTVDESANRHIDSVARARFNITRPGESAPASRRREPRGENRRACRRGRRGARACVRARARMASEAPTRRGEQRVTAGSSRRFAGAKIARPALFLGGGASSSFEVSGARIAASQSTRRRVAAMDAPTPMVSPIKENDGKVRPRPRDDRGRRPKTPRPLRRFANSARSQPRGCLSTLTPPLPFPPSRSNSASATATHPPK